MSATKVLTEAVLSKLLSKAVVERSAKTVDLNELIQSGLYQNTASMTNRPPGAYNYADVAVLAGDYFITQLYFPHKMRNGYAFYLRIIYNTNGTLKRERWLGIIGTELSE